MFGHWGHHNNARVVYELRSLAHVSPSVVLRTRKLIFKEGCSIDQVFGRRQEELGQMLQAELAVKVVGEPLTGFVRVLKETFRMEGWPQSESKTSFESRTQG